jgi:hypothetical protein
VIIEEDEMPWTQTARDRKALEEELAHLNKASSLGET